jgi:hypothetical protein
VGIALSNNGTELEWAEFREELGIDNPCPACSQQRAAFLKNLNASDDTPGRESFTQIVTDDEIIIPYTRCFLVGAERLRNITLQNHNGGLLVTHQNTYNHPSAHSARRLVFDALANPGAARPGRVFG